MEGHRVKLTEVNPYLVCVLCHGYLVDATTIAECLHSFCRSCIFRQLERKSICPICETHVHNTKLYRSLRPDKTLQDIVYKLVPGLFHNEMQRRRDFYKNHPYRDEHLEPECRGVGLDRLIYSPDDQISLSLEFYDDEREKEEWSNHSSPKPVQFAPSGPKRYLQCPAGFKMLHLKKFLRQKYGLSSKCKVDIMYRRECLPDSYSLMDVAYIYTWKRNSPMRFYYRMPDVVMKQLTSVSPEVPLTDNVKEKQNENVEKGALENSSEEPNKEKEDNINENKENFVKVSSPEKVPVVDKEKVDSEKKENVTPKKEEQNISSSRPLSKQDELPVSVLLSLGQCRVDNKDDHKFLMPHPVTPKNGIVDKKNGKVSPKPSVNKIASDLAEHKAQQPQKQNPIAQAPPNLSPSAQPQPVNIAPQQKQQLIQKQQKQQQQQQKQQLKNQQLQQQKQQQMLQQKQQMHQLMQQQHQKLQFQQHILQQQQFQQIFIQQQLQRQQQQLSSHSAIIQIQQPKPVQILPQVKESKPQEQQMTQTQQPPQQMSEQSNSLSTQVQLATTMASQVNKVSQSPQNKSQAEPETAPQQKTPPVQSPVQQNQTQQSQSPQHQTKSWPEPVVGDNPPLTGSPNVQNPQVTLNTSNGSVTIMAQPKNTPVVPTTLGVSSNSSSSPVPTMNGKPPDTPRPQGVHQNLPRTVLPKTPFVNGKAVQKQIQQKNISGQRLNNNLPEAKNGIIQQSNINNRLPTFPKNGVVSRKAGIPGGVISKTGPTLDQRIQQLYNSGQTTKPPSPGGKSESRLASWLNNRFKAQPNKDDPDGTPTSPPMSKELSMQRYKRKLQEMQKMQEMCEITQENPKPDDAKRRREVTPDVSIELMRAADMKKLEPTKKEKRPMPGLKSIQEVGPKRKKEEDSVVLDLSKAGDNILKPQLPWLMNRSPHFIPRPS